MQPNFRIRLAKEEDAAGILSVYAPYVEETAVTFEYVVPSLSEFRERIKKIQKRFPYLVAESKGEIIGYAYASPFHVRKAYDWAVETSIYIKKSWRHSGIGKKLYAVLEDILTRQNILNLNACIAFPDQEDEYLTLDSVHFHKYFGYQIVGEFHQCGYKFERWYNMVWMEKHLGEHVRYPDPVLDFEKIQASIEI